MSGPHAEEVKETGAWIVSEVWGPQRRFWGQTPSTLAGDPAVLVAEPSPLSRPCISPHAQALVALAGRSALPGGEQVLPALQAHSGRGPQQRRGGTRAPSWEEGVGHPHWWLLRRSEPWPRSPLPKPFSRTPASPGCDQPWKDRTPGNRGAWRRASPGPQSLASSSSSFPSNLLGWKVNGACLLRSRPPLSLCPDGVFQIKMGSGATGLPPPWVTAEPSAGQIWRSRQSVVPGINQVCWSPRRSWRFHC